MNRTDRVKRPRRLASDEAHSWARNLRLDNVQAKLVLMMLALYVDAEGCCFVGIPTLAMDCELSSDTVRRRLSWLDEIGAIARLPQWLDHNGRRNGDAQGKRTSDLIKLLYESDAEDIEDRAAGGIGKTAASTSAFSPSCQRGLNHELESVSPSSALGQPSQSGEGLISEPEPESSPFPPSRGRESQPPSAEETEPEDFAPAWQGWPGHQLMHRDRALAEFRVLPLDKQRQCRAAVPLFVALQAKHRRETIPNFHLWIRRRQFEEFPNARLPDATAPPPDDDWVADGSDQDRALRFIHGLAKVPTPFVRSRSDGSRGYVHKGGVGADVLAMLAFVDDSPLRWALLARGTPQCAAWQQRFVAWVGRGLPVEIGDDGIRAPCPWPPRKDGTFFEGEGEGGDQAAGEGQ